MTLTFKDINTAWHSINNIIDASGINVIDENGKLNREIQGLNFTITDTQRNNICRCSQWKRPALDEYTEKEIMSKTKPPGFRYSYGERLFGYPVENEDRITPINQIQKQIIESLKNNKNSRRAIAITPLPEDDLYEKSIPCLQWIGCLIRDNKLHIHILFRSWDIERAMPANLYGLSKLQKYIAKKLLTSGMCIEIGPMHIYAMSAHKYMV